MPSNLSLSRDIAVRRLADVLLYPHFQCFPWVRLNRQDQQDLSDGGVTRRELDAENRRLKKENKRLEMEREILKKAAAFFAKESS
jgi:transposase-like protein